MSRVPLTAERTESGIPSPVSALERAIAWTSVNLVEITVGLYLALYLAYISDAVL